MKTTFKNLTLISFALILIMAQNVFGQQKNIFGKLDQKPSQNLTETGPILWNQIDVPGSGFIVCQEFTNPEDETSTSIAADDFYVPEGETWDIGSIAFVGTFFNYGIGPVDTFNVIFYSDAPGYPGTEIEEFYDITSFTYEEEIVNDYTVVTYHMKMPTTVTLDEGHYWMSVQAKGSMNIMGKWGWNDYWAGSQPEIAEQWHWKNPLNGLGTGYIDWTPAVTVAAIFLSYDLTFALYEPSFENDLALFDIVAPVSGEGMTNAEEVTITIKNEGTLAQSGFDVKYMFNGVEVIENVGAVSINPGEYYDYTFAQTVDMEAAGPYTLEVAVMLTDDEYTDNDLASSTVYNYGDIYILDNGNTTATVTTCSGTSVDPGGLDLPFEQNDFGTVTFYPATAGSQVRLTFIEFDIQWGEMELYDGENTSAPSFGIFDKGTGTPGVVTAFNETGALTMRFEASGWDFGEGWVAFISCFDPVGDDFAVLDISLSSNSITAGEFVTTYVTVQNFGTLTQSKDVTFTADGEEFGVVNTGDLEPWEFTTVETTWNPMEEGIYTLVASVPEDEGIDDNNMVSMEQEVISANFLIEGFENVTFPPEGWTVTTGVWERITYSPIFDLASAECFTIPSMADTLITPLLQIGEGDEISYYLRGSWWWQSDLEVLFKESGTDTWVSLDYYSGFSIPVSPTQYTTDLSDYSGVNGYVGFAGLGNVAWWDIGQVFLDDINGPQKLTVTQNLAAFGLTGTASPNANEPAVYEFVVKNTGTLEVDGGQYTVILMDDQGTELTSVDGVTLQPLQQTTFELEYTFDETGIVIIHGFIDFEEDGIQENNASAELVLYVQQEGTQQVQIGTGTLEEWNYPLPTPGAYAIDEMLYLNDEIGLSGIMSGISFYYRSEEVFPIEDYPVDIYVGETLDDELPTGYDWITAEDLTLVFSGTLTMYPGDNMIYIPFDEPYSYGGDNLVVMTYKTSSDYFGEVYWYCHVTQGMQTKWTSEYNFVPDPYDPSALYPHDEYNRPNARIYVLPTQGEYCTPQTVDGTTSGFYIDGVTLNTLANTGTGSQGGDDYNDYTYLTTNLQRSKYYEMSIDVSTDGNGGAVAVWIDFNNDSDFDDDGEKICQVSGEGASFTATVPVVVDNGVELGIKRMRVRAGDFANFVNSCETINNGEAEDYLVNITQTQQVYNPVTDISGSLDGTDVTVEWGVPVNPGQAHLESFEGSTWPPENWELKTSVSLTGALSDPVETSWEQISDAEYVFNGDAAAYCSATATDFNWLISPEFSVYGDDAIRFAMHYTSDASGYSKFYVLLEVDGEWETIAEYTDETTWQNQYDEKVLVDVSDYAGKLVRLAFVTENNDAYPVAVDEVIVSSILNLTEAFQGLTGYKIYRNGVMVEEIVDPSMTSYNDVLAETENYEYCVKAVYSGGESEAICVDVFYLAPLTAPVNLMGSVSGLDVELSWTAPNAGIMRFNDDFESYSAGMQLAEQNSDDWSTWGNNPGGDEDPYVTDEMAFSGENSVLIEDLADLIWISDDVKTEGHFNYNFKLYIPEGHNAYFNVLHQYIYGVGAEWGFQAFFDQNGNGYIDADGQSSAFFSFGYNVWMYVELDINIDLDWAEFRIDGESIHSWPWSAGIFGGSDLNQLQAADFYAWNTNGSPKYYIDDVNLMEVYENENSLDYNVYRDGSMIGSTSETYYTDADLELGDYEYYVTAVYDEGESDPSNILDITVVQPPYLPFFEDFEDFTAGEQVACQDPVNWTTWSNLPCDPTEDAYISDEQAYSGENSVVIVDDNDLVLPFEETYTTGTYKASFWMYIPEGKDAYWNVLKEFDNGNYDWGLDVFFDGGNGSISIDDVTFSYAFDTWMFIELYIDLDEDGAQLLIDGQNIHFWTWSDGGNNQLAGIDFYGYAQSSGSCEYYFDDMMIEEAEWSMPVLAAPGNLEAELTDNDVHLTWESPFGDLVMLSQHDNTPFNGYFQNFFWGYGVVYDLSDYTTASMQMIDFRHSSWGLTGTWNYKVHIVDWETFTEIETVGPIQTTVNDDWELSVDLGAVVTSTGLVGIFIEPMSNASDDAYPVVDWDEALDGSSMYGSVSSYPDFGAASGDFLINLWITGSGSKQLTQAKKVKVSGENPGMARKPAVAYEGSQLTVAQSVKGASELLGYNVYRDGSVIANTTEEMYDDMDLPVGQYEYYVTALYDLGESDPSNTVIVDIITGINGLALDELSIYPNPVTDLIFIDYAGTISRLALLNASGQTILEEEVAAGGTMTVDANDLKPGIYYLKMETDKGQVVRKVIKK